MSLCEPGYPSLGDYHPCFISSLMSSFLPPWCPDRHPLFSCRSVYNNLFLIAACLFSFLLLSVKKSCILTVKLPLRRCVLHLWGFKFLTVHEEIFISQLNQSKAINTEPHGYSLRLSVTNCSLNGKKGMTVNVVVCKSATGLGTWVRSTALKCITPIILHN